MSLRDRLTRALDPDKALMLTMDGLIEADAIKHALEHKRERWQPGKPFKLLLAGYNGSRNTGADIRPEEMVRQFRHMWGENLEISVLTMNPALTAGYFRTARQLELPMFFPPFIAQEVPKHHGVIAVEGSTFKSKFANAVTIMMAGAMGFANTAGKVSVGYGSEAGAMDDHLQKFVGKHLKKSLVITRNEPSRDVLNKLGVRTIGGTDTAWSFRPDPKSKGAEILKKHGWDGKKKVVGAGPINPFWWPVKPDVVKALAHKLDGRFKKEHYRAAYFHEYGPEDQKKYERYIAGYAYMVERFAKRSDVFLFMFGMEQLDRGSCEDVVKKLDMDLPVICSDEHNMYELVSVLHNCQLLVSSRFHALVTSMLGSVPSAGVTMDERITNLMNDRGHQDLMLQVDDPNLGEKLYEVMLKLERSADQVAADIERFVPKQLKMLGQMGIDLEDEVTRVYPEMPRRDVARTWDNYLPPLSPALQSMLEKFG